MKTKCSVLVTSCDNYEDAWFPFFALFKKMWPNCSYPIFLNTETKSFLYEGLDIVCVHPKILKDKKGNSISWSYRLKQVLEQIDSSFVLFFLEDFFLQSPVRNDMIQNCLNWMENDNSIGVIDFYNEPCSEIVENLEFSEIDRNYDYCINAMCALWRKDFLINILRDENPWDFEFFGTERWRRSRVKIYTHRKEFKRVFDYQIKPALGYGIYQGKWLRNNIDLFNRHGIEVDFEKRGFIDPPNLIARERENNWLFNDVIKMMKNPRLINHYCSCLKDVCKDKIRRFRARYFNH